MDKRYQVFVSSTYEDLKEERQEVIHALLELDCMPSGMELFPAANEDQWSLIRQVIDDCDYYIVIIAGRYGSLGPNEVGYTEMEYRYAVEQGKPVIAFLHKDPESLPARKSEKSTAGRKRLKSFRDLAQQKMCKYWDGATELGSVVSRSLIRLIKTTPATGWVKASDLPSEDLIQENIRLRKQIESLESKLSEISTKPPDAARHLAQGRDTIEIKSTIVMQGNALTDWKDVPFELSARLSWNDIFYTLSPLMIDEAHDSSLKRAFDDLVISVGVARAKEKGENFNNLERIQRKEVHDSCFQTAKVQLRALGLITKSERKRSIKDTATYWTLTPYGDTLMTQLRAIKKGNTSEGG